ncbi:MAG: transmembrane protein 258 [Ruminococcaceae bacterium]|nr:transmembrane protein 258 [Oscillospiraceae bacterium]
MPSKNKFYIGITLLVQAFSLFAMFLMLCRKKKSLANAILAMAVIGSAVGTGLVYLDAQNELKRRKILAARDACCGGDFDEPYEYDEEMIDENNIEKF